MCTFEDDRSVQVCDVAVGQVRAELDLSFPGLVTYEHQDGQPTRVVADRAIPAAASRLRAAEAIERAQLSGGE